MSARADAALSDGAPVGECFGLLGIERLEIFCAQGDFLPYGRGHEFPQARIADRGFSRIEGAPTVADECND